MKNKGFTLIELIAVVVVLGLIMLIAIPSTINVLEKNKKESFINEAKFIMRLVEAEDQKSGYTYSEFIINNLYSYNHIYYYPTTNSKNIVTNVITDTSPYNNPYKIVAVSTCNCGSIRYYKIYMTDGKKQLHAVKGLPEKYRNQENLSYQIGYNDPYNLSDSTVKRYKIVDNISSKPNDYFSCYTLKANACTN